MLLTHGEMVMRQRGGRSGDRRFKRLGVSLFVEAMPKRKSLSKKQEEYLGRYFGRGCIITGDRNFEWHHLDDNPENTVVENLVPVGSRFNDHLSSAWRKVGQGGRPILLAEVDPDYLGRRAATLFDLWELGPAYGCARLGYFIASRYLGEAGDRLMPRACQALYLTRHRLNYRFMLDVLCRDIIPLLESTTALSLQAQFALVRELAGIYAEHGKASLAQEIYDILDLKAQRQYGIDQASYVSFLRRKATSIAAGGQQRRKVDAMLAEALALSNEGTNLSISVANSRAWVSLAEGRYGEALERLEPSIRRYRDLIFPLGDSLPVGTKPAPVAITIWNAAELFHNYALALAGARPRGYHAKIGRALREAETLFSFGGVRPYEFYEGFQDEMSRNEGEVGIERADGLQCAPLPEVVDKSIREAMHQFRLVARRGV